MKYEAARRTLAEAHRAPVLFEAAKLPALYQAALKALAEAARVDEVKLIRDKWAAIQVAAKLAKNTDAIDMATRIKMRAEASLGRLLRETKKNQGAVPGKTGRKGRPVLDTTPTLSDYGISKSLSSRSQKLAALSPRAQDKKIVYACRAAVSAIDGKPDRTHRRGNGAGDEWFTPSSEIELVRAALGGRIHLDPASNPRAQQIIKAEVFYTKNEDGLTKPWDDGSFCNPPHSDRLIGRFVDKAIKERSEGRATVIMLVPSNTGASWYRRLLRHADALCFVDGWIRFLDANGHQRAPAPFPSTYFYLGNDVATFAKPFRKVGRFVWPLPTARKRLGRAAFDDICMLCLGDDGAEAGRTPPKRRGTNGARAHARGAEDHGGKGASNDRRRYHAPKADAA